MILYKNKYLLIEGITTLPKRKTLVYKDIVYRIIPWDMRLYMLLKSEGVKNLPLPDSQCDYTTTPYTPYAHQKVTTEFLIANPRCFCWNEAGTGKTASCLWAYNFLRQSGSIKKILIVCPLSTTQNVWGQELFKMLTKYDRGVLTGTKNKRQQWLGKNYTIYVINHDGIKIMTEELVKWQPDLVIVDEHTAFKNLRTARFKALMRITKKAKAVWMLSGTPAPQAPTDIFAPCRIVCPDKVGRSFVRFRDLTMRQVSMYQWLPRDNFEQVIKDLQIPVIRFSRDECLDLPDVVTQTYEVAMSRKQELAFKKLRKDAILLLDGGEVTAVNEGVMRNKLLQCCSGYVYDKEHNIIDLDPKPRFEAIRDLIEESSRGVLIFMHFKSSIVAAQKYLKQYFDVRVVNGDTSVKKRTQYFSEFQKGKFKVIIAHPATMAHGVTLTAADTVIWGLITSNNEWYPQANSRIQRIGQVHKTRVVRIVSTLLEREILKRLEQKRSMQGLLLEVFN